jgi:hypothetical protein
MKKHLGYALVITAALCGTLREARGAPTPAAIVAPVPDAGTVDAAVHVAAVAPDATLAPAVVPNVETDPGGFFLSLVTAVKQGQWAIVAALLLAGLVAGLRRYGVKFIPWLGTATGGKVTAVVVSLAGTFSVALAAGGTKVLSWRLLVGALATAAMASGLFSWLKPDKPKDDTAKAGTLSFKTHIPADVPVVTVGALKPTKKATLSTKKGALVDTLK